MDTTVYTGSSAVKKRVQHSTPKHATQKVNKIAVRENKSSVSKLTVAKWVIAVVLVVAFTVATTIIRFPDVWLFFALACGLVILFHKEFSIRQYGKTYVSGWKPWALTALLVALLYGAEQLKKFMLGNMFAGSNSGIIQVLSKEQYLDVTFYAITFIVLLPLAENLFLRKAMLSSENKFVLAAMVIASLAVRGLFFAHGITGIISFSVIAVPITVVYLVTRNVYITITAQIIYSAIVYIPDIAYDVARMMLR